MWRCGAGLGKANHIAASNGRYRLILTNNDMKQLTVTLTGIRPLLMHNGRMADPLDQYAIAAKEITGKRKKTESDYRSLDRIKWEGGLYWDDDEGLIMPSDNLERCMQLGAQKKKLGKDFQAAALVMDEIVKVKHGGPKTKDALYADPNYSLRKGVVINKQRVMSVRPMVPTGWKLKFTVEYDESVIEEKNIREALVDAGALVGLGDWRPKFGRFTCDFDN